MILHHRIRKVEKYCDYGREITQAFEKNGRWDVAGYNASNVASYYLRNTDKPG